MLVSSASPPDRPSVSLTSRKPSRSTSANTTTPERRLRAPRRAVSSITRWLGRPVNGVLGGRVGARPRRAIERTRAMPCAAARGEKRAQTEHGADRRSKPHSRSIARTAAVAGPTEPADDAAAAVDHRLHLASALTRRVGIEPQTLEAGAPLDQAKLRIADPVDIAGHRAKLLDRLAQRHLPLDLQTAVVNLGDGKADAGANDHGACKHHQEERGDADNSRAFAVARGHNRRLARRPPVCRPPVSGCRSGLHTHAPSETRRQGDSARMINGKERPRPRPRIQRVPPPAL